MVKKTHFIFKKIYIIFHRKGKGRLKNFQMKGVKGNYLKHFFTSSPYEHHEWQHNATIIKRLLYLHSLFLQTNYYLGSLALKQIY